MNSKFVWWEKSITLLRWKQEFIGALLILNDVVYISMMENVARIAHTEGHYNGKNGINPENYSR